MPNMKLEKNPQAPEEEDENGTDDDTQEFNIGDDEDGDDEDDEVVQPPSDKFQIRVNGETVWESSEHARGVDQVIMSSATGQAGQINSPANGTWVNIQVNERDAAAETYLDMKDAAHDRERLDELEKKAKANKKDDGQYESPLVRVDGPHTPNTYVDPIEEAKSRLAAKNKENNEKNKKFDSEGFASDDDRPEGNKPEDKKDKDRSQENEVLRPDQPDLTPPDDAEDPPGTENPPPKTDTPAKATSAKTETPEKPETTAKTETTKPSK